MNKDTESEHLPSGKKRKVTRRNAGGQQATIKRVRGIRGMLADVKDMPLDILFEIFSRLNPIDLVNLTRTSKDLRAIFTSRSSISVWKAARANIIPAMPDCPDDLSEPQYADLVFGKGCHHCGRNLAIMHTAWLARRRICNRCLDEHCSVYFPDKDMRTINGLNKYLPEIEFSQKMLTHYFVEFAILWRETHDNIADPKEKNSWIISKCNEREAICEHARLCATWVKEYAEYQQFLIEQRTTKQLDNIAKRVAYLGWDEEVRKMLPSEEKFEEQSEVRKMCRKELTDRILVRLDAQINEYMAIVKERRLKRERLAFLKDRLPILQKVHNDHILTYPTTERYWYPMASELFLHEPKIQDIVNDTSSTLESMKERLMLILPEIYPDAINQLIRRIDDQLLEVIIASRPGEVIDRETVFGLATTLFQCSNCDTKFSSFQRQRILRYNEAMLHACTRKAKFPAGYRDGFFIEKLTEEKHRSHRHDRLTVSKTALTIVPILAKLCGFEPSTATTQMMDDLDPVFECISCGSQEQGRATMTWLGAVFHFHHKTHAEGSVKLERLNENEEDVARKRIIEMQERAIAATWTNLLQCVHCSESGTKAILMQHVKSAHGIKSPTDKDIMLRVDANHIPETFYMWPPRKP
ncbi:hypothetical protein BJ912DRAFT_1045683 [Pholiota molesta]|nr:hypothetical protein BJ912DRAFT_1045683 [Pholiota molesta]